MTDINKSAAMHKAGWRRLIACLALALLPAQQPAAGDIPASPPFDEAFMPAPMDLCAASDDGFLSGDLYGALSMRIEWRGEDMDCGGMLRPGDDGVRLVFAAPRQGERLLIVLGIDGSLDDLSGEPPLFQYRPAGSLLVDDRVDPTRRRRRGRDTADCRRSLLCRQPAVAVR